MCIRFFAALLAAMVAGSAAHARDVECLLEVDGKKFIDGVCDMTPGEKGSFQIMEMRGGKVEYFAQVDIDAPGHGAGFWNAVRGANHARSPLGDLVASRGCWTNTHARICAWKIGERHDGPDDDGSAAPKKVGDCVQTQIASLGSRLEGAPGSGSAIGYANGVVGVSYDIVEAVRRSRIGDKVTLCLVSVPEGCPKGDARGKIYSAVNARTGQGWSLPDAEHMCGGA